MSRNAVAKPLAFTLLLLVCASSLYADVYGSISGVVRDNSGNPLPGVTVTASSSGLPKARETVTELAGNYSFQNLPPGKYVVTASLADLGTVRSNATVAVDHDTTLNVGLTPSMTESITVNAATPAVDMKSTEVNFNYDAQTIEKLPLPRSYQGLFQLAPGVAAATGFAPVAGGGRQENLFLLDGASVTNPLFGYVGIGNTDTNELDIADFNVKRAAFSAEMGRATGMVVNAVTKSGTNELRGAIRQEYQPGNWAAHAKDPSFSSTTDRSRTAANIGGPLWRDHIFAYASGRYETINTTKRTNFFGAVPDEKQKIKETFGKLTIAPSASQFLSVGYRHIPLNDPFSGVGTYDLPEVALDFKNTNRIGTADYTWNTTRNTLVEARILRSSEANHFVARTDLGFKPTPFNVNDLRHMGAVSIPDPGGSGKTVNGGAYYVRLSTQDYKNNDNKLSFAQFFDIGSTSHQLKAGVGYNYGEEHLSRLSNGWGAITVLSSTIRASYYPDQPPLLGFGKTYSAYVQDSMTLTPRMNVNVGVLANRDEFGQKWNNTSLTFLKFNFGDEIQPRLGINYNLRENSGDKIYANYGRYSNMEQKSTARGLAPHTIVLARATFDKTTGALLSDTANSGLTFNATIAPGTKPTYTDEYLVGYATPIATLWSLDAFAMYRNTKRFIDDYPVSIVDAPDTDYLAGNIPAKRSYYGATIDLSRRLANRWMADINYTYNHLYGNIDIDYVSFALYNTASAIQDGPGVMVTDDFRYGPLLQNRTNVLKAFSSFEVMPNFNIGAYYRYQSGAPYNAVGRNLVYQSFSRYLNKVGTYHTPDWHNLDLIASYGFGLSRGLRLSLEGRVLNALNTQTVLSVNRIQYRDDALPLATPPYIAPQQTKIPDPTFRQPTSYAAPRRYIASVRLDF